MVALDTIVGLVGDLNALRTRTGEESFVKRRDMTSKVSLGSRAFDAKNFQEYKYALSSRDM